MFQTTRLVRAFLRAGTAGLRNLPTIHHILAEAYEEAVESCNNTLAGQLKLTMEELRNVRNIAMIIGVMQILELYTKSYILYSKRKYRYSVREMDLGRNKPEAWRNRIAKDAC